MFDPDAQAGQKSGSLFLDSSQHHVDIKKFVIVISTFFDLLFLSEKDAHEKENV